MYVKMWQFQSNFLDKAEACLQFFKLKIDGTQEHFKNLSFALSNFVTFSGLQSRATIP
jgi:hypothetical protein